MGIKFQFVWANIVDDRNHPCRRIVSGGQMVVVEQGIVDAYVRFPAFRIPP